MSSDEWWEQNIPSERLIDVSSALTGDEVSALSGLNATSFSAAQGTLDDGSAVSSSVGVHEGRQGLFRMLWRMHLGWCRRSCMRTGLVQLLPVEPLRELDTGMRLRRWEAGRRD